MTTQSVIPAHGCRARNPETPDAAITEDARCIGCHSAFPPSDGEATLCHDCEKEYAEYLAAYQPRRTISTDGRRGMTSPQTRFQWAAHRSRR